MADEPKPENTAGAGGETGTPKVFNQDELDRIVSERLNREKAKYADYDDLRKQVETLAAEKKKRDEKEMTELEKTKAALQEKETVLADLQKDREWRKQWEEKEAASIEKDMANLTEGQKAIVIALPLEQRRLAIAEFQQSVLRGPHAGKGGHIDGIPTLDELNDIRAKYGSSSQRWKDAYLKYRESKL